jgi:hypothetical protein
MTAGSHPQLDFIQVRALITQLLGSFLKTVGFVFSARLCVVGQVPGLVLDHALGFFAVVLEIILSPHTCLLFGDRILIIRRPNHGYEQSEAEPGHLFDSARLSALETLRVDRRQTPTEAASQWTCVDYWLLTAIASYLPGRSLFVILKRLYLTHHERSSLFNIRQD